MADKRGKTPTGWSAPWEREGGIARLAALHINVVRPLERGLREMTTEFADNVRAMFKAIDDRRFDELNAFYTKDCRYERPGFAPVMGIDDLLQFYRQVRVIAAGVHDVQLVTRQGIHASVTGRFSGTFKDGSGTNVDFADHYRLAADGRIASRKSYFFAKAI